MMPSVPKTGKCMSELQQDKVVTFSGDTMYFAFPYSVPQKQLKNIK